MKNYLRKKRTNTFFLLCVILLFFGQYYLYQENKQLLQANNWLSHTDVVIEEVDNLRIDIFNSLRLLEEYLLSHNPSDLENYKINLNNSVSEIVKLKNLTKDNAMQISNLNLLKNELDIEIANNEKILETFNQKGFNAATNLFLSRLNQNVIQQIDEKSMEIKTIEESLLKHRDISAQGAKESFYFTMFVLSCLADVLFIILLLYIRARDKKHFQLQQEYQQSLIYKAEKAEEVSRIKSEFLANMSHELRNPLNAIIGFAEIIHSEKVDKVSPKHKEFLEDIIQSGKHLLQLINDILDLAKIESDEMEFHPEVININHVIEEVLILFQQNIITKKLQVQINIDSKLKRIIIDPTRLKQVIYNYFSNAIKFTPENGSITIRVMPEDATHFRIEVEDTGVGIAGADLKKLFVKFQQLDSSHGKKYQGAGIGLALTRHIVEAQKGRVGVTSTPKKGSVFFAILPYHFHNN